MLSKIISISLLISYINAGIIPNHYETLGHHQYSGESQQYHNIEQSHNIAPAPTLIKHIEQHNLHEPDHHHHHHHQHEEHHESPQPYNFAYGVHDSHTGDVKEQHESADEHGIVQGSYSLIDADGYKRIVKYIADPHYGFKAEVYREPLKQYFHEPQSNHHQQPAPIEEQHSNSDSIPIHLKEIKSTKIISPLLTKIISSDQHYESLKSNDSHNYPAIPIQHSYHH